MWLASWGVNVAIGVLFTVLLATLVLLTIGEFTGNKFFIHIGGYVGIATAAVAWYTTAAILVNNTYGRAILPVGSAVGVS
jgi:succinate-acetate transporter protein